MKKIYTLLSFAIFSGASFAQTWDTTEVGNFGQPSFVVTSCMTTYANKIYVGGSLDNQTKAARLSYSSSGDKASFIADAGFTALALSDSSHNLLSLEKDPTGTYLFAGTEANGYYPALYRYDGSTWSNFSSSLNWLSNDSSYYGKITAIAFYTSSGSNDSVYIAVQPSGMGMSFGFGTQVYKSSVTNQSWSLVDSFPAYASGDIADFAVFNNQLYFITKDYPRVWTIDNASTFVAVSDTGFYDFSNNGAFGAMTVYNNELYVGTNNSYDGSELWKSANGNTWTQVDTSGLGYGDFLHTIMDLSDYNGALYLMTQYGTMPALHNGPQTLASGPQPAVFKYSGTTVDLSSDLGITNTGDNYPNWKVKAFNGSMFAAGRSWPGGKMMKGYFAPTASFAISSDTSCLFSTVKGYNTTTGHDSLEWYINSNPVSSLDTAILFFNNGVGTDTVKLVTWNGPATDTALQLVYVGPTFYVDSIRPLSQTVCEGSAVNVNAYVTAGSGPYFYTWYYQGPQADTTSTLSVNAALGTPSVTLNVKDANGCTGGGSASIYANPSTSIVGTVNYSGGQVTDGTVFLIRQGATSSEWDTVATSPIALSPAGEFVFGNANSGNYIIRAEANPTPYPDLVNTYYGDHYLWDSASFALHGCASNDTNNIQMVEVIPVTGPGSITGVVYEGIGFGQKVIMGPGNPSPFTNVIPGVPVKVGKNPGGTIVASGSTDINGRYTFTNLPYDDYRIYTDIPGYPMDSSYVITLSAAADSLVDLNYFVDSNSVYIDLTTSTAFSTMQSVILYSVYPNPSSGRISIGIGELNNSNGSLRIIDMEGKLVYSTTKNFLQANTVSSIDLNAAGIAAGVYLLEVNGLPNKIKITVIKN
jgi:hypothetical protein